ncbi:MAG: ATP-dependent DNA helicase [Lachnospiraceae bacterium]|jgi:Rad3-related DNA helicase|nr:ATP-dependent DNA helicase [Lachnospiraceae bacterium]
MNIQISVRTLVEFIMRSGDIDNRRYAAADTAMQEGSRIHRMLQNQGGDDYHAEVPVRYLDENNDYTITIDGRIDGVIFPPSSPPDQPFTIDEIKGTYRDITKLTEPLPVHLAQAKCYAFIYANSHDLPQIRVRMTYCHLETGELRYFHQEYDLTELESFFTHLLSEYRKWADYEAAWRVTRSQSITNLSFPFPYRDGQKDLVTYVYQTIYHRRKLFIEAPTGVGKTISCVYPAVKAIGEGLGEKIFYLTAKTITRTVAEEAFAQLCGRGLKLKTVTLTAKEKICFLPQTECNPVSCPYAKGHFDRINEALFTLLTESDCYGRTQITAYAERFMVCPFELGLDISLFSDAIIGDYNYLFDPRAYLRRFFSEKSQRDFIFLIDEAHNLIDRGREMYSATLYKEDFLYFRKMLKAHDPALAKLLERGNKELLSLRKECESLRIPAGAMKKGENRSSAASDGGRELTPRSRDHFSQNYMVEPWLEPFNKVVASLLPAMEKYLEDCEPSNEQKELLQFYFSVLHYLEINENMGRDYIVYSCEEKKGSFFVKLFCANPAAVLSECMARGRATILFSATLSPMTYYKQLLGGTAEDYDVHAKTVFNPAKRGVYIAADVTSKYSQRSESQYFNIARYLFEITKNRHGNYLVFFPSYMFLRNVHEHYIEHFYHQDEVEVVLQEANMNEAGRERFLQHFNKPRESDSSLLGFCVSGGIFGEGIDLKNDCLIGVIIVGTGMPQISSEREILRQYFDQHGENGFDYAFTLPGINKVLQAAGRVIRTDEDIGIVALLDERFTHRSYQRLLPQEWEGVEVVDIATVASRIEKFWNDWL